MTKTSKTSRREGESGEASTVAVPQRPLESQSRHTPMPWHVSFAEIVRACDSFDEMLAALKLYEATYVTTQHHPTAGEEAICMNAVSKAIAKAEGR